jgi:acetylornithine deacetylase/succinyl-diaminopimelate desuccinylase-like protein
MTMSMKTGDRVVDILCELISRETTNPMGREVRDDRPVERPVIEYLEDLFGRYDVQLSRQTVGGIHENLVIEVEGGQEGPGLLLESHMDTVPADDWRDRAFAPRIEDGEVLGRGACDDKGPLAAMVTALMEVLESGERLPQPCTLVAAADEEYAQTGILHFVEQMERDYCFGVFGEPTRNVPIIQHKGAARWDITALGQSAHSSQAELGRNAIYEMGRVLDAIRAYEESLQERHTNPLLTGPRITVTMIEGGTARNIVPERCTVAVDFRIMPGLDPEVERQKLIVHLGELGVKLNHDQVQILAPPLSTQADDPCVAVVSELCAQVLNGSVAPEGAPYGTDAARFNGIPAVVLGPGDIDYAHAIDERIAIDDLQKGKEIYRQCLLTKWAGLSARNP